MWPFKKKEVRVQDLVHTPAANFELSVMSAMQRGIEKLWRQTDEIDEVTEQIEFLIEIRSQRVKERADLALAVNKQRSVFGLEEVDDEGRVADEDSDATMP